MEQGWINSEDCAFTELLVHVAGVHHFHSQELHD